MNTSETVQAAQRLLAERERFGLAKYGTTVDRTDLGAGDWLQHAIEEASDLLLYLIRLQQTMRQGAEFRLHRRAVASGLISESQPAPAAAPEDAERAAYLARWKDAPEWAEWLSQDFDGRCDFWEVEPSLFADAEWVSSDGEPLHTDRKTAENLLGSVRCEPRPVQVVEP